MSDTLSPRLAALARISDEPSLVALSYALRHPDTWPDGFQWDYGDCRTCAIGLAARFWPVCAANHGAIRTLFVVSGIAMREGAANHIFRSLQTQHGTDRSKITPDHVADAIDDYLNAE